MVIMLSNPIGSACLAHAASRTLADGNLLLLSTANAAPPALAWPDHSARPTSSMPASGCTGHGVIHPGWFPGGPTCHLPHGDVSFQATQGALIQHQDQVSHCVLFSHAHIPGMPLKLPGELPYCCHYLLHHGHAQMQVGFVALELVMDMFNNLPRWYHYNLPIQSHQATLSPACHQFPKQNKRPGSWLSKPKHRL